MAKDTDFISALNNFVKYLESKRRASATIVAYKKDIEQLVDVAKKNDKTQIQEIARADIEEFIKGLKDDNYTPKSISRKLNSIKTFYRFLKAENYITDDPAADIEHPKYEVKPPRILSKLEYRALRDACRTDTRMYAIVELFLQTGIRIGELARLELEDIRESELVIKANETHPQRTVPLNKPARDALDKYLAEREMKDVSQSLFITKTGKPLLIRNIRTAIDRYFRLAGIESAKVNDLRHTFIAHHLMAGTPITVVSKLVGHKRLSTTEKYLDLVKDQKSEKVKLEEL